MSRGLTEETKRYIERWRIWGAAVEGMLGVRWEECPEADCRALAEAERERKDAS